MASQIISEERLPCTRMATRTPSWRPCEPDGYMMMGEFSHLPPCHYVEPTWNNQMHNQGPCQLYYPAWSAGKEVLRTGERPCQQQKYNNHEHHHHHHHHHYHHQWPACWCSSPSASSSSSPSLQKHADCPSHLQHTQKYTTASKHTHIASPLCACVAHILPSVGDLEPAENAHKLASAIAPFQRGSYFPCINESDLCAAPTKNPNRPLNSEPKVFPPLPSPSSPPYVLCQYCFQLLALPLHPLDAGINNHCHVLKLKCALCMRISRYALSSSNAAPMGANGELKCMSEDGLTIASTEVRIFKPKSDEGEVSANVSLLLVGEIHQETAQLGTIEVSKLAETSSAPHDTAALDILKDNRIFVEDNATATDKDMLLDDTCGNSFTCDKELPPKLNPEFAGFSSVQEWVNSIEHGCFSYCPTPLMGTGFGSNLLMQSDDRHGEGMVVLPGRGFPLHKHFGYKSAGELLKKTLSTDDDDDVREHSDTNSSPSTSNTSGNTFQTFKPPGFDTTKPTVRTSWQQSVISHVENNVHAEQEENTSIASLLKRSFKGFGERKSLSVANGKWRVVVNGHTLSESAIKRAEEQAGKLRPGTYWYDRMAGFWGIVGGPCLGVLPPFIEDLDYPMARNCSNGDTQVLVNRRELHHKDLVLLSHRGLSRNPGQCYTIGFDGVVVDEASGQDVMHLGKLAPTVETRGKGFGMYMEKLR